MNSICWFSPLPVAEQACHVLAFSDRTAEVFVCLRYRPSRCCRCCAVLHIPHLFYATRCRCRLDDDDDSRRCLHFKKRLKEPYGVHRDVVAEAQQEMVDHDYYGYGVEITPIDLPGRLAQYSDALFVINGRSYGPLLRIARVASFW